MTATRGCDIGGLPMGARSSPGKALQRRDAENAEGKQSEPRTTSVGNGLNLVQEARRKKGPSCSGRLKPAPPREVSREKPRTRSTEGAGFASSPGRARRSRRSRRKRRLKAGCSQDWLPHWAAEELMPRARHRGLRWRCRRRWRRRSFFACRASRSARLPRRGPWCLSPA